LRGPGGFPAALFRRADALRRDLLTSAGAPTVLHGDLHHGNVLRAQRAAWLAIDPKGLAGDRCFDLCQFVREGAQRRPQRVRPGVHARRLDVLCAELGLDRQRAKDWCFVHAVLDACWSFEDDLPWERAVAYAEATLAFSGRRKSPPTAPPSARSPAGGSGGTTSSGRRRAGAGFTGPVVAERGPAGPAAG
jgi:streptomycin 6-kinase